MQLCAKALSIEIEEWSERSGGKRPRRGGALVFQGTPLCQSIPGWQVGRENLPCCSAGSNMCLHYQLHCNQYLTGGLTGLIAHCPLTETKREKRQDKCRWRVTRCGVKSVLWAHSILIPVFDCNMTAVPIWSNFTPIKNPFTWLVYTLLWWCVDLFCQMKSANSPVGNHPSATIRNWLLCHAFRCQKIRIRER